MKFEAPKWNIITPALSTNMLQHVLQWERQKRCSSRKNKGPWHKNIVMTNFLWASFWVKGYEDKRRQNIVHTWFLLKTALFGHILKKSSHSLLHAWSLLLIHIWLTPSEGPKSFVNWFLKKSDQEKGTIKSDHEKKPSSMVQLHGSLCKLALSHYLLLKVSTHHTLANKWWHYLKPRDHLSI